MLTGVSFRRAGHQAPTAVCVRYNRFESARIDWKAIRSGNEPPIIAKIWHLC
jgi:hypothetical protein